MSQIDLSPGGIATLACMLEISAPKPGNVHRGADFEDVTFVDFATSAVLLGEAILATAESSLGQTVLAAVERNEQAVGTNTNLGIILLLVPLAKIAQRDSSVVLSTQSVSRYLDGLSVGDGTDVFEAIRVANPGGLGETREMDVHSVGNEPVDLLAAMRLAAERDGVARQYATAFQDIFQSGVPSLVEGRRRFDNLSHAIVYAHVAMMARQADSLIARKCGVETAEHSRFLARKAMDVLEASEMPDTDMVESFWGAVGELDFWLRSDGHRRNPGTTADLIAASLFVGIHNETIKAPFR